uniref:3'(2'),5'-bisphosphate nucleotidase CysQ n=2 Tax=Pannonibacter phragmitetus TaxID=121719 RepID=UPI000B96B296|nr:3'(2'),5'-bisphosphate nucleotidase CysQ [Pannonibacter phragmitetus]
MTELGHMAAAGEAAIDCKPLISMALEAGRAILAIYTGDHDAAKKKDGSPVTLADQAAEAVILKGLADACPDIPVIAEEAVSAGHVPAAASRYFLVDPLDGTREFISRNGEFTVNIALIDRGVPVTGVVYAPASGEIYWTGGADARMARVSPDALEAGDGVPVHVRPAPEGGLTVLASRSHACARTKQLIEQLPVSDVTSAGSSLKLCLVAAGRADVYPRLSPTMQWDIAAGHAVLRAAGGRVLSLTPGGAEATELAYHAPASRDGSGLENSAFIAIGDPELAPVVLKASHI